MQYRETLNLPRTGFEMKANLPKREPEMLRWWEEQDIYRQSLEARQDAPRYVLHDGPPYANGPIHIGTALNKVLKDIVVKHATMAGYQAPYVPGWDCHGMPIEHKALEELKLDRKQLAPLELRRECARLAAHYKDVQKEQFKRLGVRGDWENPYLTMQPAFEAKQIEVFAAMALKGLIYKGLKPVYWCWDCETALAEAEIEYHDKKSHSIYVAFPVKDGKGQLPQDARVLIWTTTPWTLPGNLAVAFHPDHEYGLYETEKGKLVLATALADKVFALLGLTGRLAQTWKGRELEHCVLAHPWLGRDSLCILGEHVSMEDGTGAVHTAPGHGHEDFAVGRAYGLEPLNPVDGSGRFNEKAGDFQGLHVDKGNLAIMERLEQVSALLHRGQIVHAYAHCWRCKNPVLYRATEQWFANLEAFREEALQAVRSVTWVPDWGVDRIGNMIADRAEWCISRQRWWGMPIPVFYCEGCGHALMTEDSFRSVAAVFRKEGADAWWARPAAELLPAGTACPSCGGTSFHKETDTMDVWFDSGSSHAAVCEERPELGWPADMYLEGSDQHRGWFQSSLLTAVVYRGQAPYKTVLTHGFIVAEDGRKMSKSLGNTVDPVSICNQYGADVLRLWVASANYKNDVSCSDGILKQVGEVYRKVRNTLRFLLGNLYDFDPARDAVEPGSMNELDRFMLHRLAHLVDRSTRAYQSFDYHLVYHDVHNFCVQDLSAFYLDVLKDRLYCSAAADPERRAAQTVLYHCLDALVRLLTPILAFTAEEAYQQMPRPAGSPVSCQLLAMPSAHPEWQDAELAGRWEALLEVRDAVNKALEAARTAKQIGSSQEAALTLTPTALLRPLLARYEAYLPTFFIVSDVRLAAADAPELQVAVEKPAGEKCERCWNYRRLGEHPGHPTLCRRCAVVVTA